jgi:poly-gamma-glutamate synthesis protein (capsule biosynthesis protein)
MQKRYRFLIDAGADAVIAHHTHVYSGYEFYNSGFIAYSLGNFIFDKPGKRGEGWNFGMAIRLTFSKEGKFSFELHPFSQCDENAQVQFLSDKTAFMKNITTINTVIADKESLSREWETYLEKARKKYLTYLEVPNSRYVRGARYYRLIPGWLTRHHKALVLNMMRCESHVEIMKDALNKSVTER